uniref:Beta-defensin n=1 Tax=Prolemur simus TaxID=1328070 RepID=A0A8C8YQH8_PROSS
MLVMKPCLMTTVIFLIFIHKTSGNSNLSQRFEGPGCGICRVKCKKPENEVHYCANGKKCCLSSSAPVPTNTIEDADWGKTGVTSSSNYSRLPNFSASGNLLSQILSL